MPTTILCLSYPVIESLASNLSQFELTNLSLTCSAIWEALHSTSLAESNEIGHLIGVATSPGTFDDHTTHWLHLYQKTQPECVEKDCPLRRGYEITASRPSVHPCKICSKPICPGCHQLSHEHPIPLFTALDTSPLYGVQGTTGAHASGHPKSSLRDDIISNQHYRPICVKCMPESVTAPIFGYTYGLLHKETPIRCLCTWPHLDTICVCTGCRQTMLDECKAGLLIYRHDNQQGYFHLKTPSRCTEPGCHRSLRSWKRPWGERYHVICQLCGMPRSFDVSLSNSDS